MSDGPTAEVVDFGGLQIAFDDRLLRPRIWTQEQSCWAAELLSRVPPGDVLELCAGAGQIGLLALARATKAPEAASGTPATAAAPSMAGDSPNSHRRLVCVDVNRVATQYLARNAAAAGLAGRVEGRTGTILAVLAPDERFPMIIADPPWVPSSQTVQFPEDPLLAIDGGEDGFRVTRECLLAIERHLAPGGTALLQLAPGDSQADMVAQHVTGTVVVGERRSFERGVVLRLDRPS
jgi:methylase of polypeptide subunit release factors